MVGECEGGVGGGGWGGVGGLGGGGGWGVWVGGVGLGCGSEVWVWDPINHTHSYCVPHVSFKESWQVSCLFRMSGEV